MSCGDVLFDRDNPHGCCNEKSWLFHLWFVPLYVLTTPLWIIPAIIYIIYDSVNESYENNKKYAEEKVSLL